jgi:hypothetical protein
MQHTVSRVAMLDIPPRSFQHFRSHYYLSIFMATVLIEIIHDTTTQNTHTL